MNKYYDTDVLIKSPSHTVGSELIDSTIYLTNCSTSPSHTVGSEPYHVYYEGVKLIMSPSHTVGSEPLPLASKM